MTDYLLPLLTFSSIFERFNVFLEPLDFALKLSLILLPLAGLILLMRKKLTFNPTFLFPFLVAVLVVEALSIFFSYNRFQSFQVVVFHLLMVALFYIFVWTLGRVEEFEKVVVAWGAGALTVSLYGFWQFWRYLSGKPPAIFLDKLLEAKSLSAETFVHRFLGKTLLRPSSTFIDATTAASFVAIAILLGLGILLSAKSRRERLFPAGVLLASLIFFAMAFSRSAILGLGAGLIAFAVLNLKGKISKRLTIGAVVVPFFVLLALVAWLSFARIRAVSNIIRLEITEGAIEMYRESPLIGIGVGNFEAYYTEVLRSAQEHGYSHSIFLTWLGETGLLGLLANLGLVGAVLLFLTRESLRHRFGTRWRLRLASLSAAFIALVVTNIFHAHYGLEFTWILLGLSVSGYYLAKRSRMDDKEALKVLGVRVDNVDVDEAVQKVKTLFKKGKRSYVVTPNPEMVISARSDAAFARILNEADLAIPDGIGLIWASRILGGPLRERVTGTDLFLELCAEAARREGKVFLLGGQEGVAERVGRELKKRYPKLRIVGTFAGDGSEKGDKETARIIREAGPIDLLFVAYGHGKQERWIGRNLGEVPVKIAMGVGGAFDFVSGEIPRAPRFIQRLGLEWLFRLVQQPQRIRRQLTLIPFIIFVFREALLGFSKEKASEVAPAPLASMDSTGSP